MTSVSRRTFLGTAAAASVSAVAAPAIAASTSGNNLPAKWDDTVDVASWAAAACSQLGVPRCRMLIRKAVKTPGSSLPKT